MARVTSPDLVLLGLRRKGKLESIVALTRFRE